MEARTQLLLITLLSFNLVSLHAMFQTYIVQLHPHGFSSSSFTSKLHWHMSFLDHVVTPADDDEESSSSRLLYSYSSAMEGFSATLSESEVKMLQRFSNVIAIRPDTNLRIHTTYSYKFLGLDMKNKEGASAWSESGYGRGTIIGVLDTGVWPESPSFSDRGMPRVPRKWRGVCQEGESFNVTNCNKKLIGARFFHKGHMVASAMSGTVVEYLSPRDNQGHGTHTSSTAGGASVVGASVLGSGAGVARGMAPGAHIAIYKVCWFNGCYNSDILAALDVAIRDRVDILSLSLGGFPLPLYEDNIAIASFRAMEHGILVICAAGNNGPLQSSVANEAPWIATVGASTLDRKFPAIVQLGNGETLFGGESMYPRTHNSSVQIELELVYLTGAGNIQGSRYCINGSLPRDKVRGKMVVCDRGMNGRVKKGEVVKDAGGAAMILANIAINQEEVSIDAHVLPATLIGYQDSILLKHYINSTKRPVARIIFQGTVVGKSRAPAVAQFSSRGPSLQNPSILKPDFLAPGVNIIAAWPQNMGPTGLPEDSRRVNFSVMSGTSMACPHASGIVALIRSAHPKWTPAAIKSALMTTADVNDHWGKPIMDGKKPAQVFAIGSGHVNPGRAIKPGLIYDIKPDDYITHLCTLGYTRLEIFAVTHRNMSCREILQRSKDFSLNYPSISVVFRHGNKTSTMVKRQVTNVDRPDSIYSVELMAPVGVTVRVKPRKLIFKRVNQSLSYTVWLISNKRDTRKMSFAEGHLTWVNSGHRFNKVRSPISVTWA